MRIVKFSKTIKNAQIGVRASEPELNANKMSRLKHQTIFLCISLFATLFISAGIVTFIQDIFNDSFSQKMKFFDALYFVVITSSTIGYGDIYPNTSGSRVCIAFMIIVIFVIFGEQMSKIISIIYESDRYDIKYDLRNHVIVFNNRSLNMLTEFLLDYLKHDSESIILIVDDVSMSEKMKKLIDYPYFRSKVYFLSVRDGITANTLVKAKILNASEVFFMTNPYSTNDEEQDKKAIFHTTYLRNFGVRCKIYMILSVFDDKYISQLQEDQTFQELFEENKENLMDDESKSHDVDESPDEEELIEDKNEPNPTTEANLIEKSSDILERTTKIETSAICFKKFKFNILAMNTY